MASIIEFTLTVFAEGLKTILGGIVGSFEITVAAIKYVFKTLWTIVKTVTGVIAAVINAFKASEGGPIYEVPYNIAKGIGKAFNKGLHSELASAQELVDKFINTVAGIDTSGGNVSKAELKRQKKVRDYQRASSYYSSDYNTQGAYDQGVSYNFGRTNLASSSTYNTGTTNKKKQKQYEKEKKEYLDALKAEQQAAKNAFKGMQGSLYKTVDPIAGKSLSQLKSYYKSVTSEINKMKRKYAGDNYKKYTASQINADKERLDKLIANQKSAEQAIKTAEKKKSDAAKKSADEVAKAENKKLAAMKSFKDAVVDQAKTFRNFIGMFDKVDHTSAVSATRMLTRMKGQAKDMINWKTNILKLQKMGLSESNLKRLVEMGPANAQDAANLASGPQSTITEMNKLDKNMNKVADFMATFYEKKTDAVTNNIKIEINNPKVTKISDITFLINEMVKQMKKKGIKIQTV
jgi:hypothetical protein